MKLPGRQTGAVALIATIIIGIFLVILTMGTVILMTGETRNATDADNSIRAYYGAESGVERAIQHVSDASDFFKVFPATNNCKSLVPNSDPPNGVGPSYKLWSCLEITAQGTDPLGKLKKDESQQFDLAGEYGNYTCGAGGPCGWRSIDISWNDVTASPPDAEVPISPVYTFDGDQIINQGKWPAPKDWPYPAAMEVSVISFPLASQGGTRPLLFGGPPTAQDIQVWNAVFIPEDGSIEPGDVSGGDSSGRDILTGTPPWTGNITQTSPTKALRGQCVPSGRFDILGRFNCKLRINGFCPVSEGGVCIGRNYIMRFRPRYAKASYKLEFWKQNGGSDTAGNQKREIIDPAARIDVTARSGDAYRRIIAKLQLRSQASSTLDYVLFADRNICKDFKIVGGNAVADSAECGIPN